MVINNIFEKIENIQNNILKRWKIFNSLVPSLVFIFFFSRYKDKNVWREI